MGVTETFPVPLGVIAAGKQRARSQQPARLQPPAGSVKLPFKLTTEPLTH